MAGTGRALPEPDFARSSDLRRWCDKTRTALHAGAMHLHISASELEAALEMVPMPDGVFRGWAAKRRARRVARHLRHAAECLVAASAGTVRTWGAFRAEFGDPAKPSANGRRRPIVIDEV